MKFFDSCVSKVTPQDVASDIEKDERFEQRLKMLHMLRTRKRWKLRRC